jgi:hypothetical protein
MANNISVKNSAGVDTVVKTTDNAGVHTPHHNVDNVVAVSDNGGSLTIDGTVALDAAALAALETITVASVTAPIPAGTNNIGDVDVASLPATPAGTNLIGSISAKVATDAIMDGVTPLTPKFAALAAAGSGDNTLVAAVASKKIRVHAIFMVAAAAVTARFESGAGGTALTGQMALAANGGFVLPFNPAGWFETASNTLLNLELSGAISVAGSLVYTEV